MGSPESIGERDGEQDEPQAPDCVLLGIREAKEHDRPIAKGVGEIILDVPVFGDEELRVRVRKCGTCAVECLLAERATSAPGFAAPMGEQAFLPQCTVIE